MHVLPAIGDRPIRDIKRDDIHTLLNKLTKANQLGAAAGVQKHVRGLFEFALDRDLVDKNPAKNLKRPELKPTKNARRNLNDAELRAVWIAAGTLGYPFGSWVRLLILTSEVMDKPAAARKRTSAESAVFRTRMPVPVSLRGSCASSAMSVVSARLGRDVTPPAMKGQRT